MWKLYDDLYIGIPSGIKIDACEIGADLVTVRANGCVGVSRALETPRLDGSEFAGAYLRDTACYLRWDSLTRAAVGVAAMNAWYNTPSRVGGLEAGGENALSPYAALAGKRLAVVGDCPALERSGLTAAARYPCPMSPDVDKSAYAALREADLVIISADALTTRALPALLDIIGEGGSAALDGVSAPASALFFAFGMPVRMICGVLHGGESFCVRPIYTFK